ncbi:hypothetical protein CLV28_1180 [Sediminihabitans luteus]|uniref:N-acetyltransferase domain-containing protein n=1 Tax=Sediminihabitans luteus TaxID=1138585 RepID=A0A2M9D1K3_9CELL|nr:GNAT family N-acetyltransferase [Sediminihabitans luteus]PJJ77953.1 hypothetical protein CLV28_1180 [Sediminihabitans luteus]GIJ00582.1 hypothetical protein Slu03_29590 [Sediminihabitans luteus]
MATAPIVLPSTDPRVPSLLADGWVVVAESWGARLRLRSDADLDPARAALARAVAAGVVVEELTGDDVPDEVAALEALTHPDYPQTPATPHTLLGADDVAALVRDGVRFFGARAAHGGGSGARPDGPGAEDARWTSSAPRPVPALTAVTGVRREGERAETEFTSVHPDHRRDGLATAVKAASVLALAAEGVRVLGTGGAQVNAASVRMNERLGYVLEERWLTLAEAAD